MKVTQYSTIIDCGDGPKIYEGFCYKEETPPYNEGWVADVYPDNMNLKTVVLSFYKNKKITQQSHYIADHFKGMHVYFDREKL